MRTEDFDFALPAELIAQTPALQRDESRLLVLHRPSGRWEHRTFRDLPGYLSPGDVLVLNDTRVIPARLRGMNARSGGHFEILLIEENAANDWWALLRPGKRARIDTRIVLTGGAGQPVGANATVVDVNGEGHRRLRFSGVADIRSALERWGEMPLPPYIRRKGGLLPTDKDRYQTVFAQSSGSIAAPTAGLHFTQSLLKDIRAQGVAVCFVTLHVGLGTFAPVVTESVEAHQMHEERFELGADSARIIGEAKRERRRIIAVGTTSTRVLETVAAAHQGVITPDAGRTRMFIHPPFEFRAVDALLTNFHLPKSTLLLLVSAFAAPGESRGRDSVLAAYAEAIRERYRFFSYGDAMLIL